MDQNPELIPYLRSKLRTDEKADVKLGSQWRDFDFDMVVDDKKLGKLLIKIRPRASLDDLALINLYKDYSKGGPGPDEKLRFILVIRSMSDLLWDVAKKLDIEILTVPQNISLSREIKKKVPATLKITSEKSWKVVSGLIRLRSSSIRNLSITQDVSYGWAHSTVNNLMRHGIAKRDGDMVSIVDMDKLLNGVAWERPTSSLVIKELTVPGKDVFEAAREVTRTLDDQKVPHAFASYMAGTLYTGHSVRHDSIQLYLDRKDIGSVHELLDHSEDESGIKLQIMAPDRGLFNETRTIDGIRVTSPAQTLLDLAGLGYKGKDLTKALVATYDPL